MIRKKRIEKILKNNLVDYSIIINDVSKEHAGHNNFDGKQETHFIIYLQKKNKLMLNKITLHRKINNLLKREYQNGMHSLQIIVKN